MVVLTTEWLSWLQETVVVRSLFWHKQPEAKSYLTTENISECGDSLTDVQWLLYSVLVALLVHFGATLKYNECMTSLYRHKFCVNYQYFEA